MAYESVFKRYEKKYLVDELTREKLLDEMNDKLRPDEYPSSVICNIYYDNAGNTLMRRSLDKPVFKEKFRIRSYCVPDENTVVFLEIKRKYKGVVYKRRVGLEYSAALELVNHGKVPDTDGMSFENGQIIKEIMYFRRVYDPKPYAFVGYDRLAFVSRDTPELRITFDCGIRTRSTDLELSHGDYGRLLLEKGMCLMEIKAYGAYPMWLAGLLSQYRLYPMSFSKIGEHYKQCSNTYEGEKEQCLQAY